VYLGKMVIELHAVTMTSHLPSPQWHRA
jgi:hypothetical protein